jgi:anti-sigma regulatory factor (Ser/Thr protein kinase)
MNERDRGSTPGLPVMRIEADVKHLAAIRHFVEEIAQAAGFSAEATGDLMLAVDEAATNVIVHAYKDRPGHIEIEPVLRSDTLEIRVRDRGPRFDPTLVPPPDFSIPLEERALGGLGIYLMRQSVDEVSYRVTPDGANELTLKLKKR